MENVRPVDWRKRRCELGLTQADFWKTIHVTQPISSRYERKLTPMPMPVQLLLGIVYAPKNDSTELIKKLRDINTKDKRELSGFSERDNYTKLTPLRRVLHLNQGEFWGRLGVTQSGGSRYENGTRSISKAVEMLLSIVYGSEEECAALVKKLRADDAGFGAQGFGKK
ncbi:MAG: hypothetical protein LBG61_06445 [Burkholderiales bacterium]|jgi:DNA-binding transcriptional regulator YiaG|nr:hypothetical protein [Burkholderiales bacterium]